MAENGTKLLIYSDPSPYKTRNEIVLDSTHMPDVPVSVITIEGSNAGERILTLCEVYVYGNTHFVFVFLFNDFFFYFFSYFICDFVSYSIIFR